MKGFIEVTAKNGEKHLIRVDSICEVHDYFLVFFSSNRYVKETYAELKALIEEATKQDALRIKDSGGFMTNGDKIRNMSNEELAEYFGERNAECSFCWENERCPDVQTSCRNLVMAFLNKEVSE